MDTVQGVAHQHRKQQHCHDDKTIVGPGTISECCLLPSCMWSYIIINNMKRGKIIFLLWKKYLGMCGALVSRKSHVNSMLHSHVSHAISILAGIPSALLEAGDNCQWQMKGQGGAFYKGDSFCTTAQKQNHTLTKGKKKVYCTVISPLRAPPGVHKN